MSNCVAKVQERSSSISRIRLNSSISGNDMGIEQYRKVVGWKKTRQCGCTHPSSKLLLSLQAYVGQCIRIKTLSNMHWRTLDTFLHLLGPRRKIQLHIVHQQACTAFKILWDANYPSPFPSKSIKILPSNPNLNFKFKIQGKNWNIRIIISPVLQIKWKF